MAKENGFFGQINGPFSVNEEVFDLIKEQCSQPVNYLTKVGFHLVKTYPLDLLGIYEPTISILINGIEFLLGKTGLLELEDVQITSIQFLNEVDELFYIDYQYE